MIRKVHLMPAACAADLGDGSERGEYVCQDYILSVLGRPHRAVNIMYTYYPNDKEWPSRISEACTDMDVRFAWDYPYDDYYPYSADGKQFEQMRDIRRHGQEVMLTITMDCDIDDGQLEEFAESLIPYGRMLVRINHECNGDWFTHNKRFSHEQICDFFVRASQTIKKAAPNVRTVFCAGLAEEKPDGNGVYHVECEDVFAPAYKEADVWSADKYLALHYGWPFDVAEAGGGSYTADDPDEIFERYRRTYERLSHLFGPKPFIQAEINADGDVTGPLRQAGPVVSYYDSVRKKGSWLSGISMYQFRDRGRLGLEIEDPNNPDVGIRQPLMDEYKKIISDPYFLPRIEPEPESREQGSDGYPVTLRWGGSEDSDGVEIMVDLAGTPGFCEVTLQEDLNLMLEFGGRWFYKKPGVCVIDLMPAFFGSGLSGQTVIPLRIFATPPNGENHENGRNDWRINQYYVMEEEPVIRVRYETPYDRPVSLSV